MDTNPLTPAAIVSGVDDHLLKTVGVTPAQASSTELMQAVAQVAREPSSPRWGRDRWRA